jgi:hypothetical protein
LLPPLGDAVLEMISDASAELSTTSLMLRGCNPQKKKKKTVAYLNL